MMRLRILNSKGHTELAGTVDEIVGEVEKFMNAGGKDRYTILAEYRLCGPEDGQGDDLEGWDGDGAVVHRCDGQRPLARSCAHTDQVHPNG
jgi:hypothetical protein